VSGHRSLGHGTRREEDHRMREAAPAHAGSSRSPPPSPPVPSSGALPGLTYRCAHRLPRRDPNRGRDRAVPGCRGTGAGSPRRRYGTRTTRERGSEERSLAMARARPGVP
jgi:hypothetical protein